MITMDTFSKVEKILYQIVFYGGLFGVPFIASRTIDSNYNDGFLNYVYIIVITLVGYLILFSLFTIFEKTINRIKKYFGVKSLIKIEDDIKNEATSKLERDEEREANYFNRMSEDQKNYQQWIMLKNQRDSITKLKEEVGIIKAIAIGFVIYVIITNFG